LGCKNGRYPNGKGHFDGENDYELWDTMGIHGIFHVFSGILQTQRVAGHLVTSPVPQIYNFASKASMAEAVTLKAGTPGLLR